jgi:MFS family permease
MQKRGTVLTIRSKFNELATDIPPMYWFLWLGTLINRFGSFVIPFLSLYLTSQRQITISLAGLIVSLFGVGAFAAQLVGGELADRLGRRPVMLMSLFVTPVFMALLGFVNSVPMIAGSTLILGFFSELYRPATGAIVADIVPSSARTRAYGYLYWAVNLGFAFAPILAGFMANINYLWLFIGDALTTFIYGLLIFYRVPETRPEAASKTVHVPLRERMRQVRREPILLALTGLTLLIGIVYMQGYVTLPLDMRAHGLTPADYGIATSANAILVVLLSIQVSNLAGKWPRFGAMAVSALLLGIGFGYTGLAFNLITFVLSVAIWTLGEIAFNAVAPALIADLSPVELRGLYQGIFGSAWGLAFFIGPVLGSWVFEAFGAGVLWSGCFVIGCVVAVSYLGMARAARKRLAAVAD